MSKTPVPCKCKHCGDPLKFIKGRGYVHRHGEMMSMVCKDCLRCFSPAGNRGKCPFCKSIFVTVDHWVAAVPRQEAP